MIFMFHLMLWKTLPMILLREQYIKLLNSAWLSLRNDSYKPYFKYA